MVARQRTPGWDTLSQVRSALRTCFRYSVHWRGTGFERLLLPFGMYSLADPLRTATDSFMEDGGDSEAITSFGLDLKAAWNLTRLTASDPGRTAALPHPPTAGIDPLLSLAYLDGLGPLCTWERTSVAGHECEAHDLYRHGPNAQEFPRIVSRLIEMRSHERPDTGWNKPRPCSSAATALSVGWVEHGEAQPLRSLCWVSQNALNPTYASFQRKEPRRLPGGA
jgi:hypothetical protein